MQAASLERGLIAKLGLGFQRIQLCQAIGEELLRILRKSSGKMDHATVEACGDELLRQFGEILIPG